MKPIKTPRMLETSEPGKIQDDEPRKISGWFEKERERPDPIERRESLLLKWGTIKGWDHLTDKSVKIIERFFADGISMSCAMDHPDEARKAILCELIDQLDGTITNDWSGKVMSKNEAKKYILEYGQK